MFLQNLKLTNFRNFSEAHLEFPKLTLLLGNNAQGKSNLLESIYFLASTKSLKADPDVELIKQGESFTRVEGEIVRTTTNHEPPTKLEVVMQKKEDFVGLEKRVKVNGVGRRTMDYLGNLVVVYFSPEDINLVTGAPALRRWHIDLVLSQVDRKYKKAISEYSAALTARNRILKRIKEGTAKLNELDYWTEIMLGSGAILSKMRREFFQALNKAVEASGGKEEAFGVLKFTYEESLLTPERLKEYLPREMAAGISLIGPQRDDFSFMFNGHNLAHFGSRGEQRIAVLDLKLAELNFIHQTYQTRPVLLLDDVFSELDAKHRVYVASVVKSQQTILSAVEESHVPEEILNSAKLFRVNKGSLITSV